jgi:hypothetical protein
MTAERRELRPWLTDFKVLSFVCFRQACVTA